MINFLYINTEDVYVLKFAKFRQIFVALNPKIRQQGLTLQHGGIIPNISFDLHYFAV